METVKEILKFCFRFEYEFTKYGIDTEIDSGNKLKLMSALYKYYPEFDGEKFLELTGGELEKFCMKETDNYLNELEENLKNIIEPCFLLKYSYEENGPFFDSGDQDNKLRLLKSLFKYYPEFDGEKFLNYNDDELYEFIEKEIDNFLNNKK